MNRLGGTAAVAGGLAWLLAFGTDVLERAVGAEGVLWVAPIAFGIAAVALYRGGGTVERGDRIGSRLAAAAAAVSSTAYGASLLFVRFDELFYAGWLVYVLGIVAILATVLAYGVLHLRRPDRGGIALAAIVASGPPVAFLLLILGYKVLTGWWVTDAGLTAFGNMGATVLVGGGWIVLGVALWLRDDARATEPSTP